MADNKIIDTMWDDSPIDVTQEANFIWSIANKLRGSYIQIIYQSKFAMITAKRLWLLICHPKRRLHCLEDVCKE